MEQILEGLNDKQKEAVEYLEGPLLILAGAGSGKTRTLTHRIANLIRHGVHPARILAATFTNKAANEMRGRLWRLLQEASSKNAQTTPPRSFMPYMGTFHGICVKILRQEAVAAGLTRDFIIYDADDQIALIKRILKDLNLNSDKNLKPKSIQSVISAEKNQGHTPEDYLASAYYPNQQKIAQVFAKYEEDKERNDALDFDDLLLRALQLFAKNPDVRRKWQDKFAHILIDEYQDTNHIQYQLVKLLVNEKRNIAVVGDDWQSIYSWRGADFTNILNFEKDFPGAKIIKLEQNYRSTESILTASQNIINHNKTRSEKTLFTKMGKGEPISIEGLVDEKAEANYVALKIINLRSEFPDLSDFAVLYRTNAQSYALEKVFVEMNLPYKIVGGVRFYDRKEVKDVLAILKLCVSGRDMVSLERVLKNVLPGVGEVSVGKVLAAAAAIDSARPVESPDLAEVLHSSKAKASVERLTRFLRETKPTDNPGEIVKSAVKKFDFSALTDDGTPSAEERMKNLDVLAEAASEYDTLEDFVADASLMSSADEAVSKNSVTLMTLHAAKGLEFPVVFIVGLEEGLFPSARGSETEADLEEERRLMYVGMTRAMMRLYLTYARQRNTYGSYSFTMPSRFLSELGYKGAPGLDYSSSMAVGSVGFQDLDGDGFGDFSQDDFPGLDSGAESNVDPFPEDLPVWE
ncbi:MAG: UvrD-helicase domain-containing protein [Candidatus Saccharibacteria bacterium]|nr:UvrD-helicase domain-containing protein [Candidatus Saccharibacteria bacterium]